MLTVVRTLNLPISFVPIVSLTVCSVCICKITSFFMQQIKEQHLTLQSSSLTKYTFVCFLSAAALIGTVKYPLLCASVFTLATVISFYFFPKKDFVDPFPQIRNDAVCKDTIESSIQNLIDPSPEKLEQNLFDLLPDEIMVNIFSNFNERVDLGRCDMVSKRWHVLANDQSLWDALTPEIAIGKRKWESFFGDIGTIPSLPKNIDQILNSDCPIWKGKKVGETHMLVLIPKTVDGEQFSLNKLRALVRSPKQGNVADYGMNKGYLYILEPFIKEAKPIDSSYWILMTKDILPESRNKNYLQQQNVIEELNHYSQAQYNIPTLLEASTCIFLEYIINNKQLYKRFSDSDAVTRCQDKLGEDDLFHFYVGHFSQIYPPSGSPIRKGELRLCAGGYDGESVGVAAVRKLRDPYNENIPL